MYDFGDITLCLPMVINFFWNGELACSSFFFYMYALGSMTRFDFAANFLACAFGMPYPLSTEL